MQGDVTCDSATAADCACLKQRCEGRQAIFLEKSTWRVRVGMRRSWVFGQTVSQGVFLPVGEDRFYLNGPVAEAFLVVKRRRALIGAAILLVLFLLALAASMLI